MRGASSARLVKVTAVWADTSPATIVTRAVPASRSRVTRRSAGAVRTSVTENPSTGDSTIVAGPAGSSSGPEQAPTGTTTASPPTSKVKSPETDCPSASLQISRKPVTRLAPACWPVTTTAGTASSRIASAMPMANDLPAFR
ncbi:MAG TPA: hypothetical protein VHF27_11360 [Acidimicrobiales bacterium]|nr:hypothetical protein [Acidimicrobiales bacterium]